MRRLAALTVALLCVAGACSVPRDDQARIVTNEKPNPSAPPSRAAGARTQAKVYFVRSSDNILEAVSTSVRVQSVGSPPGPYELLEALILDGPPRDEDRLESKIPSNVRFEVRPGPVPNEVIVILPNFNVQRLNRDALILAFQQMVFTLTELPDVNSVQFSVNNKLYKVPLRSGGDKNEGEGVRRQDYDLGTIYTTTTLAPSPTTTAPSVTAAPSTLPPGASASTPPGSAPKDSVTPSTSR